MKITKYIHSCLLFEKDGFRLLFDPGKFAFAEGLVSPEDFKDVAAIIITHNHPDHLDKDNLAKIIQYSQATIYTNSEVNEELFEAGLESVIIEPGDLDIGPFKLSAISVKHEPLLDSPTPEITAFVIDGCVLNPVDSFEDSLLNYKGIKLLILPIMAPFTTEIAVAAFGDAIAPKQIFPVHDGYAKDFFLKQRYEIYEQHFAKNDIQFHMPMTPGDSIEI